MKCTLEQFASDLHRPLKALGYKVPDIQGIRSEEQYFMTNWSDYPYLVEYISSSDAIDMNGRYYIDHYNPQLFLALAAMTEGNDWIEGEWLVFKSEARPDAAVFKCTSKDGNNWHEGRARNTAIYDKPTIFQLVDKLGKHSETSKEDSRFPFTLSLEDAKRIVGIACPQWRKILIGRWVHFIFDENINGIPISEEEYTEMRNACTDKQHELFDEIFGEDKKPLLVTTDGKEIFNKDDISDLYVIRVKLEKVDSDRLPQGATVVFHERKEADDYAKRLSNVKL